MTGRTVYKARIGYRGEIEIGEAVVAKETDKAITLDRYGPAFPARRLDKCDSRKKVFDTPREAVLELLSVQGRVVEEALDAYNCAVRHKSAVQAWLQKDSEVTQ